MRRRHCAIGALVLLCATLGAGALRPVNASALIVPPSVTRQAQRAPLPVPQITQTVDNAVRLQLRGNTDSTLTSGADLGPVADSLPIDHLWLQLRRSSESEQALEQLIDALHDPESPSFHQWLTAAQFGALYGPAQSDIDTAVAWLESEGFTVNSLFPSRMVIDFSGTAGAVRSAFGTELHDYRVGGRTYLSNASDPSIPAALAPAVVGVVSLNNRFPHPLMQKRTPAANDPGAGMAKLQAAVPNFNVTISGTPYFAVAPGDFNSIYNVAPVWARGIAGAGQTIAVIEDTNILNASDVTTFRTAFGLSGFAGTFSQVHPVGATVCSNPGVNAGEAEAAVDAEWAGVAAPDAAIVLASCKDATLTFGGLIAAQNLINGASPPPILSVSYGLCEAQNGTAANTAYVSAWQQAATEGITVFVSSGDQGAAGCDAYVTAATHGLAVNGFASTPYNVSVGGTDFMDTYDAAKGGAPVSTYWSGTNDATFASALSYIPEIPWNDSCAGQLLYSLKGYTQAYGASGFCNSATGKNFQTTAAGSGGSSNFSNQPSWQTGVPGLPTIAGGRRYLPDVSLFAADGLWNHFLVYCLTDPAQGGAPCDYTNASDVAAQSAGGTSFAAPALAGIQALINQSTGQSWGNMNTQYYPLAATEYGDSGVLSSCNASNGTASGSTCVFHDITQGDIDVDCTGTNCFGYSGTTILGILSTSTFSAQPAYPATQGWDYATGLGSVNVANLVAAMTPTQAYKLAFTVEPSASYASNAPITVKVAIENFSGAVLTGNTSAVTLALGGGTPGAALGGSTTVAAVAGVATFGNLTIDKAGTGYLLNATDGSLLGAASTAFDITAGAPSAISFSTQPSDAVAGESIAPAIVAHVQDASGNPVSGDGVTLAIANNAAGSTLTGGDSVATDSNGNATFAGVSLDKAGSGYTLNATDSSVVALTATSNAFSIRAAAAAALTFSVPPGDTTAGVAIAPAVQVSLIDAFGNVETGDSTNSVTLTLAAGSDPTFSGGGPVTLSSGVATFPAIRLTKAASGYQLGATTDAGAFTATSNAFRVNPAGAASLAFTPAPGNILRGQSLGNVTVTEFDGFGNQMLSDNSTWITLTANACGGTALGSGVLTGGAVTIDSLQQFHTPATGVGLTAMTSGAQAPAPATSTFDVGATGDFVLYSGFESCTP